MMPPTNNSDAAAKGGILAAAGPAWRQFLVDLKVWVPAISNRVDRDRLIRFSAVDERVGLKWTTVMPKQCWSCGKTEKLTPIEFRRLLRAYENPISILAGTGGGALIGLLLLVFSPSIYTLLLLVIVITVGLAILRLKSWEEDVRLTFWTCSEHADDLRRPEMAIDDQQLCVISPTLELADATREAIRAKRKRGMRASDAGPEIDDTPRPKRKREPPVGAASTEPAPVERPQPVELPPIKLAGEEDEPTTGT